MGGELDCKSKHQQATSFHFETSSEYFSSVACGIHICQHTVFSTLLLLSFSRYNIQLYFLLSGQQVYSISDNEWKLVLLYSPGVTYFNPTHNLPYSFVQLFIFLVVTAPPILVKILYQTSTCQRVLTCLKLNDIPAIHIFVDLFHGCYKDGSC